MNKWLKGLIAAIIGGAANAVTVIAIDPLQFNLGEGLSKLGTVALVSAIVNAAMYLKQSPLPGYDQSGRVSPGLMAVMALVCLTVACSGVRLQNVEGIFAKKVGREFGWAFAEKRPGLVPVVRTFALGLQGGEVTLDAALVKDAESKLIEMIRDDPYLLEDFKDLKLAVTLGQSIDPGLLKDALTGFIQGLEAR